MLPPNIDVRNNATDDLDEAVVTVIAQLHKRIHAIELRIAELDKKTEEPETFPVSKFHLWVAMSMGRLGAGDIESREGFDRYVDNAWDIIRGVK